MSDLSNPIKLISLRQKELSKSQKKLADYIIKEPEKVAFMTALALSKEVGISESTVVRFASGLGYKGYKDFQTSMQELIKNKLTTVQRISIAKEHTSSENIIKQVMIRDMKNIEATINYMDMDKFKKATTLILGAKKVYILGMRSSFFLANYLAFYLKFFMDNVVLINFNANDVFEQLLHVDKEDIVVGISYPRYSTRTIEALEYINSKGAKIISVTDSLDSPASNLADLSLVASSNMFSFVDSLVAPMSLINALILSVGGERRDEVTMNFQALESIWDKYKVYDTNKNTEV